MYNGQTVYVHYVSKFLEWVLASYVKDEERKFKVQVSDLDNVTQKGLQDLLRDQELREQLRK